MIPNGLCQCGCGQKTKIIDGTDSRRGWVKGASMRYLVGHNTRSSGMDYLVEPKTGCWVWLLSRNNKGYGRLRIKGVEEKAHRVYYERKYGRIPEGLEIDHKCSNPACVNPDHLEAVTHVVNTTRGAKTKYTESQVLEIRALNASGLGNRVLSRMLSIPRSTVLGITGRRSWKHV